MPKRHNCQARQYCDQFMCAPCGLAWDTNDTEPPECRTNIKRGIAKIAKFEEATAPLKSEGPVRLPDKLPQDVAVEMVRAFRVNEQGGIMGQLAGMQAAYRIFLDRMEL